MPRAPLCNRQFLFICTDRSRYMFIPILCTYAPRLHICQGMHTQSLQTLRQIHHRLVTSIFQWSVGSMACRIPILQFEQYCSTEATIGFVLSIVATFARFCSFLILTSSSRTCSGTRKFSRISVFSLLYCFQLIRRHILHFSSIQRCPALNQRLRVRSVVPNLCHRISHGKIPWDKHEFTRLAHWLDHWPNVLPLQQNPPCLDPPLAQTNRSEPRRVNLIQNQTPSSVSRLSFEKGLISRHEIVHV